MLHDIVLKQGDVKAGFTSKWGFIMTGLWFKDSPNLIDTNDWGRGFQADLIEGAPHQALLGDPWRENIVNPTQGGSGGNYKASPGKVTNKREGFFEADVTPLDFTTTKHRGPYRLEHVTDWPETNWNLKVAYRLREEGLLTCYARWTAKRRSYVRSARMGCFLDTQHFQPPFLNEEKRDWSSWKSATIEDDSVWISGAGVKLQMIQNGLNSTMQGFAFNLRDKNKLASRGDADVLLLQETSEFMQWIDEGDWITRFSELDLSDYTRRKYYAFPGV